MGRKSKIFEGFYRGSNHLHEGMGLGLYLTKQVVDKHKGDIAVISKIEQGTTFIISLPQYTGGHLVSVRVFGDEYDSRKLFACAHAGYPGQTLPVRELAVLRDLDSRNVGAWKAEMMEQVLWEQAESLRQEVHCLGETPLCIWDRSVLEKAESQKLQGLGKVRSSKARRLAWPPTRRLQSALTY